MKSLCYQIPCWRPERKCLVNGSALFFCCWKVARSAAATRWAHSVEPRLDQHPCHSWLFYLCCPFAKLGDWWPNLACVHWPRYPLNFFVVLLLWWLIYGRNYHVLQGFSLYFMLPLGLFIIPPPPKKIIFPNPQSFSFQAPNQSWSSHHWSWSHIYFNPSHFSPHRWILLKLIPVGRISPHPYLSSPPLRWSVEQHFDF